MQVSVYIRADINTTETPLANQGSALTRMFTQEASCHPVNVLKNKVPLLRTRFKIDISSPRGY